MGQSASYTESSINRAMLKVKNAEKEEEDNLIQLCGLHRPQSESSPTVSEGSNPSPDRTDLPEDFGPLVSLTPGCYTLNELREAVSYLPEALWISLDRVSLLYMLDNNLNGEFDHTDIARFTDWAIESLPKDTTTEQLGDAIQAHAALHCWYRCLLVGQRDQRRSRKGRWSGGSPSHLQSVCHDDISVMFMQAARSHSPVDSPPSSPDEQQLGLEVPVTKDQKKAAALHFAKWVLRMLRVQEKATNGAMTLQRRRQKYLPQTAWEANPSEATESGNETADRYKRLSGQEESELFETTPSPASGSPSPTRLAKSPGLPFTVMDSDVLDRVLQQSPQDWARLEQQGHYSVFSIEDMYSIFAVFESYGMPFWQFCRLLNQAGAVELEKELGLSEEEATHRLTCAMAVEEARRAAAIHSLRANSVSTSFGYFNTTNNNNNNNTTSPGQESSSSGGLPPNTNSSNTLSSAAGPTIPHFTVSQPTLLSFAFCFTKAYWDMLENIGFKPSSLKVGSRNI
ncbi:hypothetical protein ADEAN_000927400 [Angomonas deanei]|uniref:Uncharacterized protein n=1 Tax=Angomonas deanei TaxID=59799 RepID=A0A7G2CQT0_9TRYP|nr:hypothetical protein ADEAN_000927400 [Angomonas deanei]